MEWQLAHSSEGFDLPAWMQRSFGVCQEDIYDVVWRFTPAAAPDARTYLFHATQEMTDEPDGSLTVRFRAGGRGRCAGICFGGEIR